VTPIGALWWRHETASKIPSLRSRRAQFIRLIHDDRGERTMTMIWLLLDALGAVLAWLLDGVLALVDLISPGWDE
jgi:hypothetical protein